MSQWKRLHVGHKAPSSHDETLAPGFIIYWTREGWHHIAPHENRTTAANKKNETE